MFILYFHLFAKYQECIWMLLHLFVGVYIHAFVCSQVLTGLV